MKVVPGTAVGDRGTASTRKPNGGSQRGGSRPRASSFDPALQAKQYVAEVSTEWAPGRVARFLVLETGDPKSYLFCLLDPYGCDTTIHFPVLKRDLRPEVRRALRHGWGVERRRA